MNNSRESCAVLTITGSNEPEMLMRLANLATELNLNIEEAIGHTLADTVVLYAMLKGDDDNLTKVAGSAGAFFDGLTVFAQVRQEPPMPLGPNGEPMSPFPWRITVQSADVKGLLSDLALYIRNVGLQIISYRGEKYAPARSDGHFATLQTFIVRVPSDFDRTTVLGKLNGFSAKHRYTSVIVEPM